MTRSFSFREANTLSAVYFAEIVLRYNSCNFFKLVSFSSFYLEVLDSFFLSILSLKTFSKNNRPFYSCKCSNLFETFEEYSNP